MAGAVAPRRVAIVAVCDAIKRDLVTAGAPAEKVEVIYSGRDTDRFYPQVDGSGMGSVPDHPNRCSELERE
jgi:hypothetical protein